MAVGADYYFQLISIETYAPQFIGYNKLFLSSVQPQLLHTYFRYHPFCKSALIIGVAMKKISLDFCFHLTKSNLIRGQNLAIYAVVSCPLFTYA